MLIDTHCHLAFKAFHDTWEGVVQRARESDVRMVAVGAARDTSEKSIAIAEAEDGVYAAIGLHPTHVEDEVFEYDWFSQNAKNKNVVALGETGVDHYHLDETRKEEILEKQDVLLKQHLDIAKQNKLPVILHTRDGKTESSGVAYDHLYRVVTEFGGVKGVVHCFGGDWKTAQRLLEAGLMISFTGIVTFKNASEELRETVRHVPLDRFMIETDSPYLAPEPHRGKQNEPRFVEHISRAIAQLRGESYGAIVEATTRNAQRFFGI